MFCISVFFVFCIFFVSCFHGVAVLRFSFFNFAFCSFARADLDARAVRDASAIKRQDVKAKRRQAEAQGQSNDGARREDDARRGRGHDARD